AITLSLFGDPASSWLTAAPFGNHARCAPFSGVAFPGFFCFGWTCVHMRDLARRGLGGLGSGLIIGLLIVLSGCEVARSARNDLAHLTGADSSAGRPHQAAPTTRSVAAASKATDPKATNKDTTAEPAKQDSPKDIQTANAAAITLVGKSETEVHSLLGPPNSEEERAPGKLGITETAHARWMCISIPTSRRASSELLLTR